MKHSCVLLLTKIDGKPSILDKNLAIHNDINRKVF